MSDKKSEPWALDNAQKSYTSLAFKENSPICEDRGVAALTLYSYNVRLHRIRSYLEIYTFLKHKQK